MASNDEPHRTPSEERTDSPARSTKPRRLDVSELAASFAGASSPFGDDLNLPLPFDDLTYRSEVGQ